MSRIDGREFARTQGRLSGHLLAHEASRLEELGWHVDAVEFTLLGRTDAHGRVYLDLQAAGMLTTTCQRCLKGLEQRLSFARALRLADSLEEIEAAKDDVDRVLATPAMEVSALVEDEIILELPMVGRHEQCEAMESGQRKGPPQDDQAAAGTLRSALQEWARGSGKPAQRGGHGR